jgi:predicted metal-binding membrane protein
MHGTRGLTAVERLVRRDRALVAATIAVLVALAAVYTVAGVGMDMSALDMTFAANMDTAGGMAGMARQEPIGWGGSKPALVFLMWWLMMIAMMLPSAAPTILLYTALLRHLPTAAEPGLRAVAFMTGYLWVWAVFSLAATLAQWWLEAEGHVSPSSMALTEGVATALLLVAAGVYQFLPLKDRCLAQCRTPSDFIARHHRPGILGVAQVGIRHGAVCLGCCVALMILLFVAGIMNLYWIFGLAALVALEKLAPQGRLIGRAVGAGLLGLGIVGLGVAASS